jgi:hypothetical protein
MKLLVPHMKLLVPHMKLLVPHMKLLVPHMKQFVSTHDTVGSMRGNSMGESRKRGKERDEGEEIVGNEKGVAGSRTISLR